MCLQVKQRCCESLTKAINYFCFVVSAGDIKLKMLTQGVLNFHSSTQQWRSIIFFCDILLLCIILKYCQRCKGVSSGVFDLQHQDPWS